MLPQLHPADFDHWLRAVTTESPEQRPLVLDVREAWEVALARVSGTGFEVLHIPMHSVPERLAELDPQRPIACLCHHGVRSAQVGRFLLAQGHEQVVNLAGGIQAWAEQRDPGVPFY